MVLEKPELFILWKLRVSCNRSLSCGCMPLMTVASGSLASGVSAPCRSGGTQFQVLSSSSPLLIRLALSGSGVVVLSGSAVVLLLAVVVSAQFPAAL